MSNAYIKYPAFSKLSRSQKVIELKLTITEEVKKGELTIEELKLCIPLWIREEQYEAAAAAKEFLEENVLIN